MSKPKAKANLNPNSATAPKQDSGHSHTHDNQHAHTHSHSHNHFHAIDLKQIGLKLKISTFITILFVLAEVVAGYRANSLSLISDAAHNFTDALALVLALFAVWLQRRPASVTKTYGYHRAGILAAF